MKRPALTLIIICITCLMLLAGGCGSSGGEDASVSVSEGGASAEESSSGGTPEFEDFSDLEGKTVSMLTGVPFENLVLEKQPNVKEFTYFNSTPDMILALKSGKTDAALVNNATGALAVNRNEGLALFPEKVQDRVMGFAFAKGSPEIDKWQQAYDKISQEEKDAAWAKWTGADDSAKTLPEQDWPGKNGTVKVAACDTLEPMCYVGKDKDIVGFDIDMIYMMAKELDVHVEVIGMEFSSVLASVQSGKTLIGAGSIFITEERKQSADFLEYYPSGFVLVVRSNEEADINSFLASIKESFQKTFVKDHRYRMFLSGIGVTLLIALASTLFGTLLGFLLFLACRRGNKFAIKLAGFFHWLITGMPVVVLLMILYYIVFAKTTLSEVMVSIIGFTMVLGAEVFATMSTAVGAVDKGQMEAAYALGYGDRDAFFRHILPQTMPYFLPPYRASLVSLIKATSVVGYIAAQDLTKMGDIVRSLTYEAFFPLISIAIIYFILAAVLVFLVKRISLRWDPRRRGKKEILRGIRTQD